MTLEQFKDLAEKRLKVYGMTISVRPSRELKYDSAKGDRAHLYIEILIDHRTIDSDTFEPITIRQSTHLMPDYIELFDESEAVRYLHRVIRERFIHEADEFFKIDGVRPFHPHEAPR